MFATLIIALMLTGVDVPVWCGWVVFVINVLLTAVKFITKD